MRKLFLEVNNLKLHFPILGGGFRHRVGWVYAVDGITFNLNAGEPLGWLGKAGVAKQPPEGRFWDFINPHPVQ